jgi:DUF1365 family protein
MKSCILDGKVIHQRTAKIKRTFSMKFPWWVIRLSELDALEKKLWGFSSKRFSLYQYKTQDHISIVDFLKTTPFMRLKNPLRISFISLIQDALVMSLIQ